MTSPVRLPFARSEVWSTSRMVARGLALVVALGLPMVPRARADAHRAEPTPAGHATGTDAHHDAAERHETGDAGPTDAAATDAGDATRPTEAARRATCFASAAARLGPDGRHAWVILSRGSVPACHEAHVLASAGTERLVSLPHDPATLPRDEWSGGGFLRERIAPAQTSTALETVERALADSRPFEAVLAARGAMDAAPSGDAALLALRAGDALVWLDQPERAAELYILALRRRPELAVARLVRLRLALVSSRPELRSRVASEPLPDASTAPNAVERVIALVHAGLALADGRTRRSLDALDRAVRASSRGAEDATIASWRRRVVALEMAEHAAEGRWIEVAMAAARGGEALDPRARALGALALDVAGLGARARAVRVAVHEDEDAARIAALVPDRVAPAERAPTAAPGVTQSDVHALRETLAGLRSRWEVLR